MYLASVFPKVERNTSMFTRTYTLVRPVLIVIAILLGLALVYQNGGLRSLLQLVAVSVIVTIIIAAITWLDERLNNRKAASLPPDERNQQGHIYDHAREFGANFAKWQTPAMGTENLAEEAVAYALFHYPDSPESHQLQATVGFTHGYREVCPLPLDPEEETWEVPEP